MNLHTILARCLSAFFVDLPNHRLVFAPECNGLHRLPLFSGERCRATNYCWCDAVLIGPENTIKVVFEIEHSGIPSPEKLAGKLFRTALCRFLHHDSLGTILLDPRLVFIQIVNSGRIKPNSKKLLQYKQFEKDVRTLLPVGSASAYHLICSESQGETLDEIAAQILTGVLNEIFGADQNRRPTLT